MIMLLFYPQISAPTTAQYRTVPWRPYNVTFNEGAIGPNFFEVRWSGPREITEFDRYQVSDAKKAITQENAFPFSGPIASHYQLNDTTLISHVFG